MVRSSKTARAAPVQGRLFGTRGPREAPDAAGGAALRMRLLEWFAREQRRLPWRADRDPYRVWISEAMLQQTRVETVIPYYHRFLERFPTVAALAAAPLEDVLAAWSGLGYYRRARGLSAAARAVVLQHHGRFPSTRAALLELPGIGPYTAGAIASIAFDAPEPLVDGNVARVFARLFAIDAAPESSQFKRAQWELAAALVPRDGGAGAWNQALMELGATLCTPREPRCGACPLADACAAYQDDRVEQLPRAKTRRAAVGVDVRVLVVAEGARLLLERRAEGLRMAGLWQLPTVEEGGRGLLFAPDWPRQNGRALFGELDALGVVRHTITHHRIRASVYAGRWLGARITAPFAWVEPDALAARPVTGMLKKIVAAPFFKDLQR